MTTGTETVPIITPVTSTLELPKSSEDDPFKQEFTDLKISFKQHKIKALDTLNLKVTFNRKTVTLVKHKNHLIIPHSNSFYYFKIDGTIEPVKNRSGKTTLYKLSPGTGFPIFREGFVVIDDDTLAFVTEDDIRRSVIRPCRFIKLGKKQLRYSDFVNGTFTKEIKIKENVKLNDIRSDIEELLRGTSVNDSTGTAGKEKTEENTRVSDVDFNGSKAADIKPDKHEGPLEAPRMEKTENTDLVLQEQRLSIFGTTLEKEGSAWEDWEIESSV